MRKYKSVLLVLIISTLLVGCSMGGGSTYNLNSTIRPGKSTKWVERWIGQPNLKKYYGKNLVYRYDNLYHFFTSKKANCWIVFEGDKVVGYYTEFH